MNTLHRSLKISFPAIVILVWDEQLILPTVLACMVDFGGPGRPREN
ncbi:MAG: hypothetical protein JRF56_02130 [Deltaproteobacteria bacterium]|jgi:hypothetical protein|nr:hypothetical protein [Deltaproteobacteria bacterium]